MTTELLTEDPLLDDREAARELKVQPQTLAVWRSTKRYPLEYVKIGRAIRYRRSAVLAFIAAHTVKM